MIQLYNFIGSVKMFSEYKDEIIIEKDYLSILKRQTSLKTNLYQANQPPVQFRF